MAPPPWVATGEFLAQKLNLAKLSPRLPDGEIRVKPEAMGRGNGQNRTVTCFLLVS